MLLISSRFHTGKFLIITMITILWLTGWKLLINKLVMTQQRYITIARTYRVANSSQNQDRNNFLFYKINEYSFQNSISWTIINNQINFNHEKRSDEIQDQSKFFLGMIWEYSFQNVISWAITTEQTNFNGTDITTNVNIDKNKKDRIWIAQEKEILGLIFHWSPQRFTN